MGDEPAAPRPTFRPRIPDEVDPCHVTYDTWRKWVRSFDIYKLASKLFTEAVPPAEQRAILFNIAGGQFTDLVDELFGEAELQAASVADIVERVENTIKPLRLELQNRLQLFDTSQKHSQSVAEFLRHLRSLFRETGYGEQVSKDEMIRDLFVRGLTNDDARRAILQEDFAALTVAKCQHIASSFERILPSTTTAAGGTTGPECSLVKKAVSTTGKKKKSCYFCGGVFPHPSGITCPARGKTCDSCGKLNHFASECQSGRVNSIKDESTTAGSDIVSGSIQVATVSQERQSSRRRLPVKVCGQSVSMLIDGGSDISALSAQFARKIGLQYETVTHPPVAQTASTARSLQICGVIRDCQLELPHVFVLVDLWIIGDLADNAILGTDVLSQMTTLHVEYGGPLGTLNCGTVEQQQKHVFTGIDGRKLQLPASCFDHTRICKAEPQSCFTGINTERPIRAATRRYSVQDKQFIHSEVKRLTDEGRIQPSRSAWRSQVLVVRDREGNRKPRFCIDYAPTVNKVTPLDAFPVPLVDDLLTDLNRHHFFSSVDMRAAFHQVPLRQEERQYTAFEADGALWEFLVIPYGLRNAPSAFNRACHDMFDGLEGVYIYIDDVVIAGNTREDHDANLQAFMLRLQQYDISLSSKKCVFNGSRIQFLGHIIEGGTIRPDPARYQSIIDFPTPTSEKSLHSFLGLAVHFSKWVPNFSTIAAPLFDAHRNKTPFPLSSACLSAMEHLKTGITETVLHAVDPAGGPLLVETDASGLAIGGVLSQDGKPISFHSKRLSPIEQLWSPPELEGYAALKCCEKFKPYLWGRHFTLLCDQQGFVHALSSNSSVKNKKFARWRLEMSDLDYTVRHRPGYRNTTADALSRAVTSIDVEPFDIVRQRHVQYGHPGAKRLADLLRRSGDACLIRGLLEKCASVASSCETCSRIKPQWAKPEAALPMINSTAPWQRISIDFQVGKPTTPQGTNLLVIIDEYSRFPFAAVTADREADTVIKVLTQLFYTYGPPVEVHSDRGAEFRSQKLADFLQSWGVRQTWTSAYNPQSNGQVESYNGTLWKTILCLLDDQKKSTNQWHTVLGQALHSMRSLVVTTTGSTPHDRFLTFARPTVPAVPTAVAPPHRLLPGSRALLRRHVRNKADPVGDEVSIEDVFPGHACVVFPDGQRDTVNLRHLAPLPGLPDHDITTEVAPPQQAPPAATTPATPPPVRRSTRTAAGLPPDRLHYNSLGG